MQREKELLIWMEQMSSIIAIENALSFNSSVFTKQQEQKAGMEKVINAEPYIENAEGIWQAREDLGVSIL